MVAVIQSKSTRNPQKNYFLQEKGIVFIEGGFKYCQETSLHGWQYIYSEQGYFHKIIWLVIVLLSIVVSLLFLVDNTKAYLNSTTVMSIASTTESLKDLIFPSLYICNVNQVTQSFLKNLNVEKDDAAAKLLFDELILTGSVNYITNE